MAAERRRAPAVWFLVAVLIAVAIFEVWAIRTDNATISQAALWAARQEPWVRWVGAIGFVALVWHLFWGGPIKRA